MATRAADFIEQVIALKERQETQRLAAEMVTEVNKLRLEWAKASNAASAFADFIPMRLVTLLEVFIRDTVRQLVDRGEPFLSNAAPLTKETSLSFLFFSHLQGQKLTVGDIVAHSLSLSSIDKIIATLRAFIPDLEVKLRASHLRWTEDAPNFPLKPIIGDYDLTVGTLTRMIEVRHILTHEVPRTPAYGDDDIYEFCAATADFLEALDWVVVEMTYGTVPRTQVTMNQNAGAALGEVTQQMTEILADLERGEVLDQVLVRSSQVAWEAYANAEADLAGSFVEGGSMQPMIWASEKADLTAERIKRLEYWQSMRN